MSRPPDTGAEEAEGGKAMKHTCDNCYHFIMSRGLTPAFHCLEDHPEQGQDKIDQLRVNGKTCSDWTPNHLVDNNRASTINLGAKKQGR